MKKILFLLASLLAVSSALCFTGCNDKGNADGETENDNVRTRVGTVEDGENDDTCPDCEERGMPKVRFEFKDGRPAGMRDGNDDVEPHRGRHGRRPHTPRRPRPAPPEEGGQDKNEN